MERFKFYISIIHKIKNILLFFRQFTVLKASDI